jgi:hypothetical protein
MIDANGSESDVKPSVNHDLEGLIHRLASALPEGGNGPLEPFRAIIEQLVENLDRTRTTARLLQESADQLVQAGRPPSFRLLHELGECSRRFGSLSNELRIVAHAEGLALPETDSLHDLSAIAGYVGTLLGAQPPPEPRSMPADVWPMEHFAAPEVEHPRPRPTLVEEPPAALIAPAEVPESNAPTDVAPASASVTPEPSRARAMEVLSQVVRLQSVDGKHDFAPLESCREQARGLLNTLESNPDAPLSDEARMLASGEHPFCSLLTIALGAAPMDDGEWAAHHSRISGELGRDLAIAAARARLTLAAWQQSQFPGRSTQTHPRSRP